MSRFFISYRRNDGPYAGRLADNVGWEFGHDQVFYDVESLLAGRDFGRQLEAELEACDAMLAVIGPSWHEEVLRLDREDDYVRREIEAALRRDIPTIPVLVGRARMPQEEELPPSVRGLRCRQTIELGDGPHFRSDVQRVLQTLKGIPKRGRGPDFTLTPRRHDAGDLKPKLHGAYRFLWVEGLLLTLSMGRRPGGALRLAVADQSQRKIHLYDVPVGERYSLATLEKKMLRVDVQRPNIEPPRSLHVWVNPPFEATHFNLPSLAPDRFDDLALHPRLEALLLP